MKKILLSAIAIVAIAAPALAADLPVKARPMAPAAASSWSGCYVGGYVGGAVPSRGVNTVDPSSVGGAFPVGTFYNTPTANAVNGGLYSYNMGSSVIGGGTLGCNWQPSGSAWVFGLEGEAGYMKIKGSAVDPYSVPLNGGDTTDSTKIGDWYGVIAGRVGYAWDRVLVYGKGGVGFANINSSVTDACNTGACGGGLLAANLTSNRNFWVAGGGVEYAFNTNWSVKAEYLFLGLNETYNVCGPGQATAAGSPFCSVHNIAGIHTGKVGINYHF